MAHEIVGGHGRALAVDAARGDQEGYFLALQKTDRAGFSITERAARANYLVDPKLERRRDAEVVHWHTDHPLACSFQLAAR